MPLSPIKVIGRFPTELSGRMHAPHRADVLSFLMIDAAIRTSIIIVRGDNNSGRVRQVKGMRLK